MEKIPVYDEEVQLLLLNIDSLITTASKIIDPNNDAPAKYKQKLLLKKKYSFFVFSVGNRGMVSEAIL